MSFGSEMRKYQKEMQKENEKVANMSRIRCNYICEDNPSYNCGLKNICLGPEHQRREAEKAAKSRKSEGSVSQRAQKIQKNPLHGC